MCKCTFLNLENSRQKFTENPLTVWPYFTSTLTTHLAAKKGIIYSQALRYNMIISEDHILQEKGGGGGVAQVKIHYTENLIHHHPRSIQDSIFNKKISVDS